MSRTNKIANLLVNLAAAATLAAVLSAGAYAEERLVTADELKEQGLMEKPTGKWTTLVAMPSDTKKWSTSYCVQHTEVAVGDCFPNGTNFKDGGLNISMIQGSGGFFSVYDPQGKSLPQNTGPLIVNMCLQWKDGKCNWYEPAVKVGEIKAGKDVQWVFHSPVSPRWIMTGIKAGVYGHDIRSVEQLIYIAYTGSGYPFNMINKNNDDMDRDYWDKGFKDYYKYLGNFEIGG